MDRLLFPLHHLYYILLYHTLIEAIEDIVKNMSHTEIKIIINIIMIDIGIIIRFTMIKLKFNLIATPEDQVANQVIIIGINQLNLEDDMCRVLVLFKVLLLLLTKEPAITVFAAAVMRWRTKVAMIANVLVTLDIQVVVNLQWKERYKIRYLLKLRIIETIYQRI